MNHIQFVTTNVLSYASQLNAFKTAIAFHPCGTLDLVIPGAGPVCPSLDLFDATTVNGDPAEPNSWTLDVELKSIYYTGKSASYLTSSLADAVRAQFTWRYTTSKSLYRHPPE